MTEEYQGQAGLLLEVLRIAAKSEAFALKGGTAINFFFQDCPRLSVDIDLHYLPLNGRDEAFRDIRENMEAIKSKIEKSLSGIKVSIPENFKVLVESNGILVKIEINEVIRGTLLPPVERPLCPSLEKEFGVGMTVNCIAEAELYAGKFCAALQRQHPRDIFDAWLFFEKGGELTQEILDAFVVYLISHRKPAHEVLDPVIKKDMQSTYNNRFLGMARIEVALENLLEMQLLLPGKILSALTERHRTFLVDFNKGDPAWNLLPFSDAKNLPAVRWKQINLDKMSSGKRGEIIGKLIQVLKNNPYQAAGRTGAIMQDRTEKLEPQEQLAREIVDELIERRLVSTAEGEKLRRQIVDGTLKREDWSLLVDTATGRDSGGGND